jgi:hypothetical protein
VRCPWARMCYMITATHTCNLAARNFLLAVDDCQIHNDFGSPVRNG